MCSKNAFAAMKRFRRRHSPERDSPTNVAKQSESGSTSAPAQRLMPVSMSSDAPISTTIVSAPAAQRAAGEVLHLRDRAREVEGLGPAAASSTQRQLTIAMVHSWPSAAICKAAAKAFGLRGPRSRRCSNSPAARCALARHDRVEIGASLLI